MAGEGRRGQLGAVLYRVYVSSYMVITAFALLGDLSGDDAKPLVIAPRISAAVGLVVIGVLAAATTIGRVAVGLRPSPAEVQLALLAPVDRSVTLARLIGVTSSAATFAAGGAALVLILVASPQFAGLSIGVQFSYVAFAAAGGLLTYGGHLLVAERQLRIPVIAVTTMAVAASVYDVIAATSLSPATTAIRGLREGAPVLAVVAPLAIGVLAVWRGTEGAEELELEKISRGGDIADKAAVALHGNDLRTLLVLQRSMSVQPFRHRPLLHLGPRIAHRFPVLVRTLRGVARWRAYRWIFVATVSAAIGGLLRVQPASPRTVLLAALCLWLLGLAACEPFAQEHDRSDRLALLPMARGIEYRLVVASWSVLFVWLAVVCAIALSGHASVVTAIALGAGCASGATASGVISFRRLWRPLAPSAASLSSPAPGAELAVRIFWPAIVAAFCIAGWGFGATGVGLVTPGVFVFACLVFWIRTGGLAPLYHRVLPAVFPAPQ